MFVASRQDKYGERENQYETRLLVGVKQQLRCDVA